MEHEIDFADELRKLGINSVSIYSLGTFVLSIPAVHAGVNAAIVLGIAAVKALVASVIAFVVAHFLLILTVVAIATLVTLITLWIIKYYKEQK